VQLSNAAVRCHYGINKSLVFFIKKNECITTDIVKASALSGGKISCITHGNSFLEKIKGALCIWFKDGGGGWHGTVKGVSENAEEEKAIIDHVFLTKSSVSSSVMQSVTYDQTDNIQSETKSFQEALAHMFTCLLTFNVYMMFRVWFL